MQFTGLNGVHREAEKARQWCEIELACEAELGAKDRAHTTRELGLCLLYTPWSLLKTGTAKGGGKSKQRGLEGDRETASTQRRWTSTQRGATSTSKTNSSSTQRANSRFEIPHHTPPKPCRSTSDLGLGDGGLQPTLARRSSGLEEDRSVPTSRAVAGEVPAVDPKPGGGYRRGDEAMLHG